MHEAAGMASPQRTAKKAQAKDYSSVPGPGTFEKCCCEFARGGEFAINVRQFPIRVPSRLAPFTHLMPTAKSGLNRRESETPWARR
jgi:hypothetical protein